MDIFMTHNYPWPALLSAEQEVALAQQIEAGVCASAALAGDLAQVPDCTRQELVELVELGEQAWQRYIEANVRMVAQLARRAAGGGEVGVEEYFQEGVVALAQALQRFDHRQGVRFMTYALPWVRNAIGLHVARRGGQIDSPAYRSKLARQLRDERSRLEVERGHSFSDAQLAAETGRNPGWLQVILACGANARLEDVVPEPVCPGSSPEEVLEQAEPEWFSQLTGLEAKILGLRYGFRGGSVLNQREVAERLGLSRTTVCRLEGRALERSRQILAARRPSAA